MNQTFWAQIGVAVATTLLTPIGVVAQQADNGPRVQEAREHFDAADEHYAADRFALAAQEYQAAYELLATANHPRAGLVLFNVGRSEIQIRGHEAQARSAFEEFLRRTPVNAETQDNIRRAQQYLEDLDARDAELSPEPPTNSEGHGISPVGPIILGAGGAALLTGLVLVSVAGVQDGELLDRCPEQTGCNATLRSDVDSTRTLAVAGDILWIAGAVVAAGGLVLTLVLTDESSSPDRVSLQSVPGGGLVSAGWSFN